MSSTGPVSPIESFLQSGDSETQTTLRRLRMLIIEIDPKLDEAIKWGRLTFTRHCNWREWICALEPFEQGVRLLFHQGVSLEDPQRLLQGSDRFIRYVEFRHPSQVDDPALTQLLSQAIKR